MKRVLIFGMGAVLGVLSLSQCGMLKNSASAMALKAQRLKDDGEANRFDVNEGNTGGGGIAGVGNVSPRVRASQLPDEDDIVWAPEDPNEPIQQLEELWQKPVKDSWYVSYDEAMTASRQSGKPVLIWFTHSGSSPLCKVLSAELFSTNLFEKWASEKVIRLRVDSAVYDDNEDLKARKIEYVKKLKKRYKILGAPVVLMVSPREAIFGRYVGYRSGDPGFYLGRLKNSYRVAMEDYGKWRDEMEEKGYRVWHDRRGRTVFAKLLRYSKGRLLLVEPDGTKSQTTESKLSRADRDWVKRKKQEYESAQLRRG